MQPRVTEPKKKPMHDPIQPVMAEPMVEFQPKTVLDRNTLPANSCYWIPGINRLVYAKGCDFIIDIKLLQNQFCQRLTQPTTFVVAIGDPWARDFIVSASNDKIYVMNENFVNIFTQRSCEVVLFNCNIGLGKLYKHFPKLKDFDMQDFYAPTRVITEGGNGFQCVNTRGEKKFIVGELGLISRCKLSFHTQFAADQCAKSANQKIGSKSKDKYEDGLDQKNEYANYRQKNKQILSMQVDADTKVIPVPNAWGYHIDLEMVALPNGVVMLHSFVKSLELMKQHPTEITLLLQELYKEKQTKYKSDPDQYPEPKLYTYEDVMKNMEDSKISQELFAKTKRKLEKHGFHVHEVCGFITVCEDETGVIVTGFNGLPIVTQTGSIAYTLPPNAKWYEDYFKAELNKCGVQHIHILSQASPLRILRNQCGFFRCQTNTIAEKHFKQPENDKTLAKPKTA